MEQHKTSITGVEALLVTCCNLEPQHLKPSRKSVLSGRYYDPLGNRPSMSHQFQTSFGPLCCQEATPFVKVCCVPGKEWYHIDILWHLTYLDNHKSPHPLSIETFIETLSTHLPVLLPPAPVRWMLERRPPYIMEAEVGGKLSWTSTASSVFCPANGSILAKVCQGHILVQRYAPCVLP